VTHPAHAQPFTASDWFVLGVVISPILAVLVWGLVRARHARAAIRDAIRAKGFDVLQMKQRWFRFGPFSFWMTSRGQVVYRLIVRDSAGRRRMGWARWGRTWLPRPDTLEFQWDE